MREWRHEHLVRLGYDDALYRDPRLQWAQRNFVHALAMVEDRYLYDPVAGRYTVPRYLEDLGAYRVKFGEYRAALAQHRRDLAEHRRVTEAIRALPAGDPRKLVPPAPTAPVAPVAPVAPAVPPVPPDLHSS